MTFQQKIKGVTLLEVILVLAIASSLLVMMLSFTTQKSDELRRDKTVLQTQQILNASLSYYINKSAWPIFGGCDTGGWYPLGPLQPTYLPDTLLNNPYGNDYSIACNNGSDGGGFIVESQINNATNAAIIAGRLPLAYRTNAMAGNIPPPSCTTGDDCTIVVATVNIPGQNLNNARSVNFASVYYSGSCVPAPVCPPNMKPNILVMPEAVNGIIPSTSSTYPINGFTAYIRGDGSSSELPVDPNAGSGPPLNCAGNTKVACAQDQSLTPILPTGTLYWRVCLNVMTSAGPVVPTSPAEGKIMGTIVAFTRCVPNNGNETPSGSIDVWDQR